VIALKHYCTKTLDLCVSWGSSNRWNGAMDYGMDCEIFAYRRWHHFL